MFVKKMFGGQKVCSGDWVWTSTADRMVENTVPLKHHPFSFLMKERIRESNFPIFHNERTKMGKLDSRFCLFVTNENGWRWSGAVFSTILPAARVQTQSSAQIFCPPKFFLQFFFIFSIEYDFWHSFKASNPRKLN